MKKAKDKYQKLQPIFSYVPGKVIFITIGEAPFFPSKFSIRKASPFIASENNYRISSCYFLGDPFQPREILREAYAKDMHGNYTT